MGKLGGRIVMVSMVAALAACSGLGDNEAARTEPDASDPRNAGGGVGGGGLNTDRVTDLFRGDGLGLSGNEGLTKVNRHLWRASLDTLAFLPLNSTDPFTGVIATDWAASPEAPEERFKVAAYVTSPQLTATALKVAVFREVRDQSGAWVTAPVSGQTARRLEDAILLRARQLKLGERETG